MRAPPSSRPLPSSARRFCRALGPASARAALLAPRGPLCPPPPRARLCHVPGAGGSPPRSPRAPLPAPPRRPRGLGPCPLLAGRESPCDAPARAGPPGTTRPSGASGGRRGCGQVTGPPDLRRLGAGRAGPRRPLLLALGPESPRGAPARGAAALWARPCSDRIAETPSPRPWTDLRSEPGIPPETRELTARPPGSGPASARRLVPSPGLSAGSPRGELTARAAAGLRQS